MSGDFDIELPTSGQVNALKALMKGWQAKYGIPDGLVLFHHFFNTQKTCPGSLLSDEWIGQMLRGSNFVDSRFVEKSAEQATKQASILQLQGQLDYLRSLLASLIQRLKGRV